jgi:lipopolysaccharide export system protein LptA
LRLEFNENNELRHANAEKDVRFQGTGQNSWQLSAASAEAVFASGGVLNQLIAKKDVEVKETGRTLRAQLLKLFFEPVEGTKGYIVSRAVATTNVSVQYEGAGGAQGLGEQLDWDRKNDTYRLTGKPAVVKRGSVGAEHPVILIDPKSGTMILPKSGTPARTTMVRQAP